MGAPWTRKRIKNQNRTLAREPPEFKVILLQTIEVPLLCFVFARLFMNHFVGNVACQFSITSTLQGKHRLTIDILPRVSWFSRLPSLRVITLHGSLSIFIIQGSSVYCLLEIYYSFSCALYVQEMQYVQW